MVIGIVDSNGRAETLVTELQRAGFSPGDISVLFPDKYGTRDFAVEHHTKAPEGAIAGVGAGGVVGATVGLLAGIGAIAVPGLGALIAAGPIMGALSGAAAGATVGGVTGALIGMGIPENEAKAYEGKLRSGSILVGVHVESSDERKNAEQVMERVGAEDVHAAGEAPVPHRHAV
jgi:hypothetical protein